MFYEYSYDMSTTFAMVEWYSYLHTTDPNTHSCITAWTGALRHIHTHDVSSLGVLCVEEAMVPAA